MSIIKCPECGKKISEHAENCPHCGLPKGKFLQDNEAKEEVTAITKLPYISKKRLIALGIIVIASAALILTVYLMKDENTVVAFKSNGKYGLIDLKGKIIIAPKYEYMGHFFNGLAPVSDINGKVGYINKKGSFVIDPIYDFAGSFYREKAAVMMNGFWGVIDKKGKFIINPEFDDVWIISSSRFFVKKNNKYALFINDKRVTEFIFQDVYWTWNKSPQYIVAVKDGKYGIINMDGKTTVDFKYYHFNPGHWTESKYIVAIKDGKYGIIDINGEKIIDFKYNYLYKPSNSKNNFVIFSGATGNGILNIKGEEVLSEGLYSGVSIFPSGKVIAKKEDNFYILSEDLKVVKKLDIDKNSFCYLDDFSQKMIVEDHSSGKKGIINDKGEIYIKEKYDEISKVDKDKYIVNLNGYYGVIDQNDEFLIPPLYQEIDGEIDVSDITYFLEIALKKHELTLNSLIGKDRLNRLKQINLNRCSEEFLTAVSDLNKKNKPESTKKTFSNILECLIRL